MRNAALVCTLLMVAATAFAVPNMPSAAKTKKPGATNGTRLAARAGKESSLDYSHSPRNSIRPARA